MSPQTRTDQAESLIVASNVSADNHILNGYRKRWKIECLFRALKTRGFWLDGTHMTFPAHVTRLLWLLILASVWSVVTLGLRALVRGSSCQFGVSRDGLLLLIRFWTPHQTMGAESIRH